jgi:response regulator RpfG family c-di-GMP phosphodiesterase
MDTVVLIENDPPRLVVMAMILRALGYGVLEAGNEDEAVRESENHADPIALALCDAQAPAAGSAAFTQRFNCFHPETRFAVLCDSRVTATAEARVIAGHMRKPVDVDILSNSLRELLAATHQLKVRKAGINMDEILTVCLIWLAITAAEI